MAISIHIKPATGLATLSGYRLFQPTLGGTARAMPSSLQGLTLKITVGQPDKHRLLAIAVWTGFA
jgi:hypothetical protein